VRFWDSSAVVPLLVVESTSDAMESILAEDSVVSTWWGTPIECVSAISRLERAGLAASSDVAAAHVRLSVLETNWVEISPADRLREDARRLVRVHGLRAADALQLAAAVTAATRGGHALPFVTLDERLALAASREGFTILGLD
jgi:predicted nucleic acid-binding protein